MAIGGQAAPDRPRILYVVYWGAAEPLGQSLVLPPVTDAVRRGAALTLITFEKPIDLTRKGDLEAIRLALVQHGVRWRPLRYHKWPKWPATLFDVLQGVVTGLFEGARGRPSIVHARTFIGGAMGMLLAPLLRAKLVYHNEGFYPDEQVDGGVWREGSLPHRLGRFAEQLMYARAAGIVVLSERAKGQVERLPSVRRRRTPVVVVPSCVDLARFPAVERSSWHPGRTLRLVYVGSIGNRYLFDRVAEFVAAASRRLGRVSLRVLTRTAPSAVEAALRDGGLPGGTWSIGCVPHAEMSKELAQQDAGLFLLTRGISEHGCSPTKVGEYWASGLPVVITPNVSDIEDIIVRERVGVVVPEFSPATYDRAVDELVVLLQDPDLPERCRAAAERYYALTASSPRVLGMYARLTGARTGAQDDPAPLDSSGVAK